MKQIEQIAHKSGLVSIWTSDWQLHGCSNNYR